MDAIALLKADHRSVEKHFKDFEKAGKRADAAKAKLVASIIEELSVHAEIEELVFYRLHGLPLRRRRRWSWSPSRSILEQSGSWLTSRRWSPPTSVSTPRCPC